MTAPDFLSPFAAHVRLAASGGRLDDPHRLVETLLEEIAERTATAGASLVGHVKCLVRADDVGTFQVNLTDPRTGARAAGDPVESAAALDIDLVVLVYGLDHVAVCGAVTEAVAVLAGKACCDHEIDIRSDGHAHGEESRDGSECHGGHGHERASGYVQEPTSGRHHTDAHEHASGR